LLDSIYGEVQIVEAGFIINIFELGKMEYGEQQN
jgi:hypothetical protein